MITSVIGKTLLSEYNRREGKNLSAEEFFDQVFHPVFYGHERYLQAVSNSPFTNPWRKGERPDELNRANRLSVFKSKVHSGNIPDASYAIGFAASGLSETTSGQVSNLHIPLAVEDIYASWIGGGLGIRVQGGLIIYFDHPEILWSIYEGWNLYRDFLEKHENLRPNQIDTWSGQWFSYVCRSDYDELSAAIDMSTKLSNTKDGEMEFNTQQWTEVLFGLANRFKQRRVTGYVCSLGQTNTTIGFVPFELPELLMPLQFYRELFDEKEFFDSRTEIQKMYGTAHRFRTACQKGAIGVPALEPKDLRNYMTSAKGKTKNPDFAKASQETRISFNVYQTWLLAMLNKKELWQKADEAATTYLKYVAEGQAASRQRANAVNAVLEASSKRKFIDASGELVKVGGETAQRISELVEEVHMLPDENFQYFQTLIKFRHAFWQSQTVNPTQGENE